MVKLTPYLRSLGFTQEDLDHMIEEEGLELSLGGWDLVNDTGANVYGKNGQVGFGGENLQLANKKRSIKARSEYNSNPKRCKTCKEPLPFSKRWNTFCNRTCSTISSNTGTKRFKGKKE